MKTQDSTNTLDQLHRDIDQMFIDIGRHDRGLDELDRLRENFERLTGEQNENRTDITTAKKKPR